MERLQLLFNKYLDNTISENEYAELWQLLEKVKDTDELTPALQQLWTQKPQHSLSHTRWENQLKVLKEIQQPVRKVVHLYRKIAVAACFIFLLGVGGYFFLPYHRNGIKNDTPGAVAHDVKPPDANKATLILANGKTVILDSADIGSLTTEGVANAHKVSDAKLVYAANTMANVEYHTLQIPKGSKPMQLQLADGSQVWLNAASSITFPNIFAGNERNVSITGEVYFEVAHNAAKPFVVKVNEMKVEVLGTHFNINSYSDEDYVKTTLLEGKVKISNNNSNKILLPAQQARMDKTGALKIINHVNIDEVMAWKEGNFLFENYDIYEVMKQLKRWYDIDVEYQTKDIHQHF
ncbi:MAG: FecR domain-containing protein, partial [Chitinophagaceae bacterium]|nr:FecR domain-containing protein [Chitinophagaceae bacterium]